MWGSWSIWTKNAAQKRVALWSYKSQVGISSLRTATVFVAAIPAIADYRFVETAVVWAAEIIGTGIVVIADDRVAARMTPAQIAEALKLAREWKKE